MSGSVNIRLVCVWLHMDASSAFIMMYILLIYSQYTCIIVNRVK